MRKTVTLIIAIIALLSFITPLYSCADEGTGIVDPPDDGIGNEGGEDTGGGGEGDGTDGGEDDKDDAPKDDPVIFVPDYKDYGRGTIDFDKIEYKRPDVDAVIKQIDATTALITDNTADYEEQLSAIEALEEDCFNYYTMLTYASIMVYKNSADEAFALEHSILSKANAGYARSLEQLFVAAAASEHMLSFESDYFGEGELLPYLDGGKYTDEAVRLLEEESGLESEYSTLSPAVVKITYRGVTDTFDAIRDFYAKNYGEESVEYALMMTACTELYQRAMTARSREILTELILLRRDIATELGYDSYTELAYEEMRHGYSPEDMEAFISDIKNYVLPVYTDLFHSVFMPYFYNYECDDEINSESVIPTVYGWLSGLDPKLSEAFDYMLQHGLHDVMPKDENRYEGAFSTYLYNYNAPYLFVSASGTPDDYLTFIHEFGHFYDYYVNFGNESSLDLSEISSNALELLALTRLDGKIDDELYRYLEYAGYLDFFEILIYQGFYSAFEHLAYDPEIDIEGGEGLGALVSRAARQVGLNDRYINQLDQVLIPHIIESPFYVQAYCTAITVSMDIYFAELEHSGAGFAAYGALIEKKGEIEDFEELLLEVGLESPFKKLRLRSIADDIYYEIMGSHFFSIKNNAPNVA